MTTYDIGDQVRVTATLTDLAGTATDPTAVTLTVRKPDGTSTSYTYGAGTVTKSATGVYYKDVDVDQAGEWNYRWTGTGALVVAEEGQFYVRARRV